jgi:DNA mismatch repair ATPase MutS
MRIMSSMRIADNLEENTSTFYAELSKLKSIIEAVNRKEPVFLLLDEILRGTNSQDRQTGSRALIQQLIRENGAGLLATHDLSLTDLEQQFPGLLRNFHFDVSVEGEELYFDYRLKAGICQSMNASILMKKIGIDL